MEKKKMIEIANFCLDADYLEKIASEYKESYQQNHPFPHIVIDNFLPEQVLNEILQEFPKPDAIKWQEFNAATEKKLASTSELQMGNATRFLLYQLNSSVFINFLEELTGIKGVIPDPHFEGGGLHQIKKGGFLKMHVDFNKHKKLNLDRRLNLLIYLNKDWKEEYGGYLELWDEKVTRCEKKVLPVFNRCVIFSTTDFSYHGLPEPLNCPEGGTRKSLALYYYSNGRPAHEVSAKHSTVFRARPGEEFEIPKTSSSNGLKKILKQFIPSALIDTNKKTKIK